MSQNLSISIKIKYLMISLIVLIVFGIAGTFAIKMFLSNPIEIKDVNIDSTASLKLDQLEQISKKNGITQWVLKASSAKLINNENKAVLKDVFVKFYTDNNQEITLSSKNGILDTQTHDMSFSDDVIVRYATSVLKTQTLHYNKKEHIIHTQTRIVISNNDSYIEADSMRTELDTDTTVFEGNIKGMFSGNFDIL